MSEGGLTTTFPGFYTSRALFTPTEHILVPETNLKEKLVNHPINESIDHQILVIEQAEKAAAAQIEEAGRKSKCEFTAVSVDANCCCFLNELFTLCITCWFIWFLVCLHITT